MSAVVGAASVRRPDQGVWTAASLALAYVALFAVYAAWALASVRHGASAWPFVIAPLFSSKMINGRVRGIVFLRERRRGGRAHELSADQVPKPGRPPHLIVPWRFTE